jgi:hypothetical protein
MMGAVQGRTSALSSLPAGFRSSPPVSQIIAIEHQPLQRNDRKRLFLWRVHLARVERLFRFRMMVLLDWLR